MRRKILYLAMVCVGCVFGVMAQRHVETATEEPEGYEYVPIVREGIEWGYGWSTGYYGISGRFRITMSGDTIINGKEYKKYFRSAFEEIDTVSDLAGFVREEDRKVYCVTLKRPDGSRTNVNNIKEELVYDFNAVAGDMFAYLNILSTDYVEINGKYRKRLVTDGGAIIVEGLGAVEGSNGDLLSVTDQFAACFPCYSGHLSYVREIADNSSSDGAVYEYDEQVDDLGGIDMSVPDAAGLSVMQGDGWLRVGVDCDCYRRAELTDAKGAIVDAAELSGWSEAELSTAGLSPGVYVVSLISDTAVRSVKVLVK